LCRFRAGGGTGRDGQLMAMTDHCENGDHHRRSKRSLVLLTAKVRTAAGLLDVRLRNLSQNGALLEAEAPPPIGTELVFERGQTIVKARVAWTSESRFGLEFHVPIEESEVLVHVGRPKPVAAEPVSLYRRAGFNEKPLTRAQRETAAAWVNPQGRAD
jgi:hypothetical protein